MESHSSQVSFNSTSVDFSPARNFSVALFIDSNPLGFGDVAIEIVFGNLSFGAEPDIFKTLGVPDAFLKRADDVRPPADVGMDETIAQFRRARLPFGIEAVKRGLEAVKIKLRRIFVREQ